MGAWTSTFMIGISSTSFSPLAYIPTPQRRCKAFQSTFSTHERIRTSDTQFWRLLLYRLSYTRVCLFPLGSTIMFPTSKFSVFMRIYWFTVSVSPPNFSGTTIIIPTATSFLTDKTVVPQLFHFFYSFFFLVHTLGFNLMHIVQFFHNFTFL